MAVAENITFGTLKSPSLVEASISKIVKDLPEEAAFVSKKETVKDSFAFNHFSMFGSVRTGEEKDGKNYLSALLEYMSSVLISGAEMNKAQIKTVDIQEKVTQFQMKMIQDAQAASQKAFEKSQHLSGWQKFLHTFLKIFSYVASIAMVVFGAWTGNPVLLVGGVASLVATATDAIPALMNAIGTLPAWARILVTVAIAIGAAVAISAVGAGLGGASLGSVTAGQFATRAILVAVMLNLPGEVAKDIAAATGASKETQEAWNLAISTICAVGTIVLVAYKGVTSMAGAEAGEGLMVKVRTAFNNFVTMISEKLALKFQSLIQAATLINSMLQGGFSIASGVVDEKRADSIFDFGKAQSGISFYTDLMGQTNSMIKADQQAISSTAKSYAEMNNNWDAYVAPYRTGTENMV